MVMRAKNGLLFLSLVYCGCFLSGLAIGAEEGIDDRDYCSLAELFAVQRVEDEFGADHDFRNEGNCEVRREGATTTVTAAYSTRLSRERNSPFLHYEVTFKAGEFMGKANFSLCSWRVPIDAPVKTLEC